VGRPPDSPAVSDRVAGFAAGLEAGGAPVTLEAVIEGLGDAGHAAVILLLALPLLIPLPGVPLGLVFGCAIFWLAIQLVRGLEVLHLPAMFGQRLLPQAGLRQILQRAVPRLRRLEAMLRPGRMTWLAVGAGRRWAGGVLGVLALLLALPIPLGDPISAVATILVALGLMEHDGLAVLAGMGVSVAALAWNGFVLLGSLHLLDMAVRHLF
jgi:hypothetical protein